MADVSFGRRLTLRRKCVLGVARTASRAGHLQFYNGFVLATLPLVLRTWRFVSLFGKTVDCGVACRGRSRPGAAAGAQKVTSNPMSQHGRLLC